jgi:hypothetical protein
MLEIQSLTRKLEVNEQVLHESFTARKVLVMHVQVVYDLLSEREDESHSVHETIETSLS